MYKYIINIKYDGSSFNGYATQPHKNTVQDNLEEVLTLINSNNFVKTFASSRTDAKVHALDQYVQFSLNKKYENEKLKTTLNKMLKDSILVKKVYEDFEDEKNVRYDVINKTYKYLIINKKDPFYLNYATYINDNINLEKLIQGCNFFIGEHDFSAFSNHNTNVTNRVRKINYIKIKEYEKDDNIFIEFKINGNGFLYNMVRLIIGTAVKYAQSTQDVDEIKTLLENKKKDSKIILAPAKGLYLEQINFK